MLFPSFSVGKEREGEKVISATGRHARVFGVWNGEIDTQEPCGFLMKLPAEVRNEVYGYVFAEPFTHGNSTRKETDGQEMDRGEKSSSQTPSTPARPPDRLSLLLTCRKINMEASVMAFHLHTFLVKESLTFYTLRQRASILPPPLFDAISSMSTTLHAQRYTTPTVSEFFSNTLLLSTSIKTIVIRERNCDEYKRARLTITDEPHNVVNTCESFLPAWFKDALRVTLASRSYVWQKGRTWSLTFPYVHGSTYDSDIHAAPSTSLFCEGNCTALLTQEGTYRKVEVALKCGYDYDYWWERECKGRNVRLVPDIEQRLDLEVVNGQRGVVGLMYEPGEEYWEGLGKRKTNHLLRISSSVGKTARLAWRG